MARGQKGKYGCFGCGGETFYFNLRSSKKLLHWFRLIQGGNAPTPNMCIVLPLRAYMKSTLAIWYLANRHHDNLNSANEKHKSLSGWSCGIKWRIMSYACQTLSMVTFLNISIGHRWSFVFYHLGEYYSFNVVPTRLVLPICNVLSCNYKWSRYILIHLLLVYTVSYSFFKYVTINWGLLPSANDHLALYNS